MTPACWEPPGCCPTPDLATMPTPVARSICYLCCGAHVKALFLLCLAVVGFFIFSGLIFLKFLVRCSLGILGSLGSLSQGVLALIVLKILVCGRDVLLPGLKAY